MLIDTVKAQVNGLMVGQITQVQIDVLKADIANLVPDIGLPPPPPPPPAASLVNPSFEIPFLRGGFAYNPSAAGVGWTFSPNSGIQGNGSAWGAARAPNGTQTAFIQGTSTITQTLSLAAGSYTLSFQASSRAGVPQPIKVTIDGTQIGSLVSLASRSFAAVSIPFSVATTGAHTLTFTGTDPNDKTAFIDNVTVQ